MFHKKVKKGNAFQHLGPVYENKLDWGAILFWGFVGLLILGALAN